MFQKIIDFIKRAVKSMFPNEIEQRQINVDFNVSAIMAESIELWSKLYADNIPWVEADPTIKSLNLPATIASEMARLVTVEMVSEIHATTEQENERSEYLNKQYQIVIDELRPQTEYAVAKGGMVFKPSIDRQDIVVDFIQADEFYPVRFDSRGNLVGAIFIEQIPKDKLLYTRLEFHDYIDEANYKVTNTAYVKKITAGENEGFGRVCALSDCEEWAELEEEINFLNLEKPLFSYFKMPLANNIDSRSNLGVSIYSKAIEALEQADRQYSRIIWEFEGTELAIDVGMDLLIDGIELPEREKRLYRKLDADTGTTGKPLYEVFSPEIRDESLYKGLNKHFQDIEFRCGLAYGTISDMQMVAKTATEINSSKQRSYSTVADIQKALQKALEHLIESMDYLTTLYSLAQAGEFTTSFIFDDSIVVDALQEQSIMLAEVGAGLIRGEAYLMKRYGISEEEALKMLPELAPRRDSSDFDNLE